MGWLGRGSGFSQRIAYINSQASGMLTPSRSNSHSDSSKEEKLPSAVTVEFGIQVDFRPNPENAQNCLNCEEEEDPPELRGLSALERRKLKKKMNKKRRKERAEEMQREAADRQHNPGVLRGTGGLRGLRGGGGGAGAAGGDQRLPGLPGPADPDASQRKGALSQYIQKSIWEYTQSILYENPFERNEDHLFYGQMVDQIYERYLEMERSSRQIEKVINIYLREVYARDGTDPDATYNYNNLAINTFNYMIETDETLKNLLHLCDRKVSPQKQLQRQKLETLISIIDNYSAQDYLDEEEYDDDSSTNCTQPELEHELGERRRRKKKVKGKELSSEEEDIVMRLEQFTLKEYRGPCRVEEEVLGRWRQRAADYRRKH